MVRSTGLARLGGSGALGLFSKKKKVVAITCPICVSDFDASDFAAKTAHWRQHVWQIPEGEGDASGQFTWDCACGSSGLKWPNIFSAISALSIHMYRQHGVAPDSPLDDHAFLLEMERKLGMKE